VIYNWERNNCYGAASEDFINRVANYYKPGSATKGGVSDQIADPNSGKWYVAENYVVDSPEVTNDNWLCVTGGTKLDEPWPVLAINQQTAEEAYLAVLDHAGCSFPNRDELDVRLIKEVSRENIVLYLRSIWFDPLETKTTTAAPPTTTAAPPTTTA
jgi:pectate lyase